MKKLLFNTFFVLLTFYSTAQTVDNSITSAYPKSVINRVYDVASKITLNVAEQQSLADLFQDEEDDINALVLSNAAPSVIDSVKANYKSAFNQLLSSQQINDYYNACNATKVNTTARLMAAMLQHKYNATATMQQYFNQIYTWREEIIERIWNKNIDTPTRNNNLYNTMFVYDSLLGAYTNAANSNSYFMSRASYLDSVQPIDTNKLKVLNKTFFDNCIDYKNRAYADNFKAAMNKAFNNIIDSPYYIALYNYDIVSTANNAALSSVAAYINRDKVSAATAQQILPLLLKRERVVAIANRIYPIYTPEKQILIDNLVNNYQIQIDNLIAQSGSFLNASQIDIAIQYASQLELNQEQISSLQIKLTELNNLRRDFKIDHPESEYDSKAFESEVLNNILTAEQYTQVLTTKFNAVASNQANTDWNELIRLDLSRNYDTEPTKIELTNYHLAVLIAYYRNANKPEEQYSSVRSINAIMPNAMRVLLEHWDYRTPYNDTPDTFFQW